MTFLNPAMLWGLAAISIPILIHIFNLRRTKKMEFSTLMFLKEIQQSKYKKIKLKQLLILLCRIMMIIFLVLAFAQPFDTGYLGKAGEKAASSVLIILDNSFSMETKDLPARSAGGQGNYFETGKRKAAELADLLNDRDEIYFTTVSDITKAGKKLYYGDISGLKDSIMNSKISDITKNLDEVLYYSKGIIENFSMPTKEIFLITDGQKSFMKPDEFAKPLRFNANFTVIDIGKRKGSNVSLDTVNVVSKIFEKNKNVRIKCIINNRNNFNVSNKTLMLKFGERKDEKVVDIPANSSVEVEFNFKPEVAGFAGGSVEVLQSPEGEDEINRDNKRYFSFYIPDKINLLLVSGSNSDIEYIKLALNSYEETTGSLSNFFNINETSESEFTREELNSYDCIVFANKFRFSEFEAEKIKTYVENGGGAVIFPGKNISVDNYNQVFLAKLEMPPVNSYFGDISGNQNYKFGEVDFEHPILEGIYKPEAGKNLIRESPKVKYGLNLITEKNSQPVIKLDNEKNFLAEYSYGKGKILFYAVAADMSYSDFPQTNIFPPLVVRSILYPSNKFQIQEATTGKDYFLDLASLNISDTLEVSDSYKIYIPDKGAVMNFKNILRSNLNYKIVSGDKIAYQFPCNFKKSESDLEKLSESELRDYFKNTYDMGVNVISADEKLISSVTKLRIGKDVWQYFLILALLFLAAEYYFAKTS